MLERVRKTIGGYEEELGRVRKMSLYNFLHIYHLLGVKLCSGFFGRTELLPAKFDWSARRRTTVRAAAD